MNIFLRNLFLFFLTLLGLVIVLIGVSSWYMNSQHFSIGHKKNILVIGDSHTECAIDDSVFTRAANYSKSATSYLYSYAALKKLVSDNPQIDTVLLSFQSSSLSYERERTWIFGESDIARQVPVFLPYLSAGDFWMLKMQMQFYKSALEHPRVAWDYYFHYNEQNRKDWIWENIGHFRELPYARLKEDIEASKQFLNLQKEDTVSYVSIAYIKKIAGFCKSKGIRLILINTPVYRWNDYVNDAEFDENRNRFLNDMLFVDYAHFPIEDSCRADIWHLNKAGAVKFSVYLNSNLVSDIRKQNRPK